VNRPLVVMWTLSRMYSEGRRSRPVTLGGRLSSTRASMNGSISPMWPITSLQLGMAVEDAAEDHAQDVQARLGVPAPRGGAQRTRSTAGLKPRVVGVADGRHGLGGCR
jgi:hypothetical protein